MGTSVIPSMLSTNAYPTFTFRVHKFCSNSDRSVSNYSVHWACVCCWVMVLGRTSPSIPQGLGFYLYHAAT